MRHFHISHNAPYLHAKIFIMCYLRFSFTGSVPREIENNAYAKFWGQIKCIVGMWKCRTMHNKKEGKEDKPFSNSKNIYILKEMKLHDFQVDNFANVHIGL